MEMGKKAVIFDWGGVLIDNPEPAFVQFMSQHFRISEEAISPVRKALALDFQRGISESEYWERFCSELSLPLPSQESQSLWSRAFAYAYSPKREMFQLVSDLQQKGYKTGLLSNTETPSVDFFYAQRYAMFDATVFSCLEGVVKPDSRIYRLATQRLGVYPAQAVFIDDRADFVEGAKSAGIDGFVFESPAQAIKELKENYGISCK